MGTTTSSGSDGSADGRFTIANVRPGTYVLRAFAKGVLGEYDRTAKVTVEAGKKIDLGKIEWKPVRYGKQIWEIGYPDRTADKFFKGDGANYWLWGWGLRYSGLFPNDITYTIGKSDYRKDWFFQEVPHSTTTAWLNPDAKDPYNQHFGWVQSQPPTRTRGRSGAAGGPPPGLSSSTWRRPRRVRQSCASRWLGLTALTLTHRRQRYRRLEPSVLSPPTRCVTTRTRACGTSTSRSSTPL